MDVLSFCDGFNNHHIGTLRFWQQGASTPSTEPVTVTDGASANDCTTILTGLGADGTISAGINELCFCFSDIVFLTDDGTSLPAKLTAKEFRLTTP